MYHMLKNITFVFCLVFLVSMTKAQEGRHYVRKGVFTPTGGLIEFYMYTYNQDNQLIKEEYYDKNSRPMWIHHIKYDAKGLRSKSIRKDLTTNTDTMHVYLYDDSGKLERVALIGPDRKLSDVEKYTYDTRGRVFKIRYYTARNRFMSVVTFEYDEAGNTRKKNIHMGNNQEYRAYFYDKGKVKKEEYFNNRKKLVETITYDYNPQGRKTREVFYDPSGKIKKICNYTFRSDN